MLVTAGAWRGNKLTQTYPYTPGSYTVSVPVTCRHNRSLQRLVEDWCRCENESALRHHTYGYTYSMETTWSSYRLGEKKLKKINVDLTLNLTKCWGLFGVCTHTMIYRVFFAKTNKQRIKTSDRYANTSFSGFEYDLAVSFNQYNGYYQKD